MKENDLTVETRAIRNELFHLWWLIIAVSVGSSTCGCLDGLGRQGEMIQIRELLQDLKASQPTTKVSP